MGISEGRGWLQRLYRYREKDSYRVFIKYCVFSELFKIFCFPSVSVCVHTPGRKKTSAAAELAEFRKITTF